MVGEALDIHLPSVDTDDTFDNPDIDFLGFENTSLLNMKLDKGFDIL